MRTNTENNVGIKLSTKIMFRFNETFVFGRKNFTFFTTFFCEKIFLFRGVPVRVLKCYAVRW